MSVEAVTWALSVPVSGNAKIVLLGLANHAHPDGSEAYPTLRTLAKYGNCDKSTVRRNLRKLVADGLLMEDGLGPQGQGKYRLPMGLQNATSQKATGVATGDEGGGIGYPEGVAAVQPEPSIRTVLTTTQKKERARERAQSIPDTFPDALRPHLLRVLPVLSDVAVQHNAREVTPRGVALAIEGAPGRRYVAVAYELASWAQSGRVVKDVVATYRTFLSKADIAAGVESLDAPKPTPQRGSSTRGTGWTGRDVLEHMGVGHDI